MRVEFCCHPSQRLSHRIAADFFTARLTTASYCRRGDPGDWDLFTPRRRHIPAVRGSVGPLLGAGCNYGGACSCASNPRRRQSTVRSTSPHSRPELRYHNINIGHPRLVFFPACLHRPSPTKIKTFLWFEHRPPAARARPEARSWTATPRASSPRLSQARNRSARAQRSPKPTAQPRGVSQRGHSSSHRGTAPAVSRRSQEAGRASSKQPPGFLSRWQLAFDSSGSEGRRVERLVPVIIPAKGKLGKERRPSVIRRCSI